MISSTFVFRLLFSLMNSKFDKAVGFHRSAPPSIESSSILYCFQPHGLQHHSVLVMFRCVIIAAQCALLRTNQEGHWSGEEFAP